jgi:hypothetical protein
MVAKDTVVGIVGAVILVAVMAAVFVYELNNQPDEVTSGEAASIEDFEEHYPDLNATDDLDGDGKANFEDADLDGDGTNNTEDEDVAVTLPVSAEVAAPTASGSTPYTMTFTVGNGSESLQGQLSYTRMAGGLAPNVQGRITGPDGFEAAASSSGSGTSYTLTFEVTEPLPPGEYTLTLTQEPAGGLLPAGQPATVTGELEIQYADGLGPDHEHP